MPPKTKNADNTADNNACQCALKVGHLIQFSDSSQDSQNSGIARAVNKKSDQIKAFTSDFFRIFGKIGRLYVKNEGYNSLKRVYDAIKMLRIRNLCFFCHYLTKITDS